MDGRILIAEPFEYGLFRPQVKRHAENYQRPENKMLADANKRPRPTDAGICRCLLR